MMSADIGVPWRSSAVCSSESRSPSLSSLPPLPDLIPIRKSNNNTLIKANLKHATGQNNGSVCTTNTINMSNSHHSDQNGNIANVNVAVATTDDIKPSAAELSLCQSYDGKQNGRQHVEDNDQQCNDGDANLSLAIKQERRHSDDGDAPRKCANANSADAMANVCVSIGASYFTNRNGNTVQCDSNVDGGQLKQMHKSSSSSSSSSASSLVKNEECRNSLMNNTSQSNSSTAFGSHNQNAVNNNNDSVHAKTDNSQQTIKAGNKKNQNYNASDIPRRTTRSALDTYECKARLYTPLPAHYYSVQYARAARKPKRKVMKGKGRGGVTKVGRKPKAKSNTKNASLALGNVPEKSTTSQTPSRINPIFLFVKRDNTRIVEVRCEDYDKRNRIRLTKTASGWRAIPRTDDSSTKTSNDVSSTMQPKVMVKRLESDTDIKITNENEKPSNESDNNSTWRVNPFSQNRIFIKKNVCSLNNNNDSEFNSLYENRQSSDCNSSNAEHSSGLDTSASDKVHLVNESSTRKKHKKKKKKKKQKHKSKLDKMLSGQHFVSHSDATSKQTAAISANNDDGNDIAHATLIPKSMSSTSNASGGNASECKFTIRLSKNGESSFVATKKFSTISSTPAPKAENFIATEKSSGLKLKIISERQQFLTERGQFREEHEQEQENGISNSNSNSSNTTSSSNNTNTEMHSAAIENTTNVQCDRVEMYGECDAKTNTNLDALSASVNVLAATIDCEKIDTKKEVVTPAVSPYNQVAYPCVSPPPLPPPPSSSLLQPHQPIRMPNGGAVEVSNTFIQPTRAAQSSTPSETISSCRNTDIETFSSPDSAPVETFDSKLSVKQCVASLNSASAAAAASTQFQCSDNNNRIANNLSDEKHLSDCVDLLDDSSYDIENIQVSESHEIGVNSETHSNQLHHDLGEYHDLIARIQSDDDLLNGDNTMSGTDLIDSLVERGCKDNNISGEDDENHHNDLKDTICLSDDYNDVDTNLLLSSQPVVEILSRLNSETMASSSKCLSFNDAGEIEGLSDSLFANAKGDGLVPFNQSTFEELSMTLKGLEKQTNQNASGKDVVCTTIVSPDSCEDELPKDLSFKKTKEMVTGLRVASPRTISRGSDAIQSPQPSGLPAVPPSPDIMMALHQHKKQNSLFLDISSPSPKPSESNHLNSKSDFFDLSSPLSKDDNENNHSSNTVSNSNSTRSILKRTLQREPLDLGHKHRKSASPTISCSEEVQRASIDGEPLARRIKTEHRTDNSLLAAATSKDTSQSASAKDPDPLTQLRLLINNPEWKLPDPILVPKNRLNAVLASPAREIPLLLTTRPELRLPEAFAYPSILQDPDILVISFAQLETIIRKQSEFMKDADPNRNMTNKHNTSSIQTQPQTQSLSKQTAPQREQQQPPTQSQSHRHSNAHHKDRKHADKLPETPLIHDKNPVKSSIANVRPETSAVSPGANNTNLANDINSATLEALNQMFWLPYLNQISQMGQITPEILKAMSLPNLAAMQPNAFSTANQYGLPSAMPNLNNPLELAMWQEAAANKAAIQRLMEMNAQNVREAQRKAINEAKMQQRNQENIAAALRQQNLLQQTQMQKSANAFFQNFQNRSQQTQPKNVPPFLSSTFGKDTQTETPQRSPCNLQSPPISKRVPNPLAQYPFFAAANNFPNMTNLHKFGMAAANQSTDTNNGSSTNALRKARKDQMLQQQQHLQSLLLQNAQQQHAQVNMPVHHQSNESSNKSLMSLLQQSNLDQIRTPRNDNINSNKMNSIPSFDLTSPNPSSQNNATNRPKLRVKNGLHLLDPLAAQRRFLSGNPRCNESPEIGSTTNGIDEMMANAGVLK